MYFRLLRAIYFCLGWIGIDMSVSWPIVLIGLLIRECVYFFGLLLLIGLDSFGSVCIWEKRKKKK